ncbi:MAG: hypothetical protein QM753_11905 [Thermomicrobiales bacterium]
MLTFLRRIFRRPQPGHMDADAIDPLAGEDVVCPVCGTAIGPRWFFCEECGRRLHA